MAQRLACLAPHGEELGFLRGGGSGRRAFVQLPWEVCAAPAEGFDELRGRFRYVGW